MQTLRLRHLAVGAVAFAIAVSACGGGGSGRSTATTGVTTPPTTAQSAAAATAQITSTWQTFFSAAGSPDQVQGMDPQLRQAYSKAALPKGLVAKVTAVTLLSQSDCQTNGVPSPCAKVTYDLDAGGKALLPNAQGFATMSGNQWLVSKSTFCALEALGNGGQPPAGC